MPLAVFLSGKARVITHRTALQAPFELTGCAKIFFDTVGKASSLGVALYLALTRKKLFGADIMYAGLATHFVPASKMSRLLMVVGKATACPPPHTLQAVSSSLASLVEYAGPSRLQTFRGEIDRCFSVCALSPSFLIPQFISPQKSLLIL